MEAFLTNIHEQLRIDGIPNRAVVRGNALYACIVIIGSNVFGSRQVLNPRAIDDIPRYGFWTSTPQILQTGNGGGGGLGKGNVCGEGVVRKWGEPCHPKP